MDHLKKTILSLKVVDMRWGVRDEATDDHMTTSICLEEIRDLLCYNTLLPQVNS